MEEEEAETVMVFPLPRIGKETPERPSAGKGLELDSSFFGAVKFSVVCKIRCASARQVAETLMVVFFPAVAKAALTVGIITFLDGTAPSCLGSQVAAETEISGSLPAVVKDVLGAALIVVGKTVHLLKLTGFSNDSAFTTVDIISRCALAKEVGDPWMVVLGPGVANGALASTFSVARMVDDLESSHVSNGLSFCTCSNCCPLAR
jgi:hypothetical protein